jgi:hypothetical protein
VRLRFDGEILGVGSTSGTRVVVGRWARSPFGSFADVMVQLSGGHRLLLAPTAQVAAFVAGTYTFDEVREVPVTVTDGWHVTAGPLDLRVTLGGRPPLGRLLRAVPPPLARLPAWAAVTDLPARALGMRTRGSAGSGRTEWYGAQDLRTITALSGTWDGDPLGDLAPVRPPVTFGFASVPAAGGLTRVTTTVRVP